MSQAGKVRDGTILPDIETITTDDANVVGPDANFNINFTGAGGATTSGNPATNTITVTAGGGASPYTVNSEILAGGKTLTSGTDETVQFLDPNGAARNITLDTASASAGDFWVIIDTAAATDTVDSLVIKQGVGTIDIIYPESLKTFIYNGTNWVGLDHGVGNTQQNISIGYLANTDNSGVAIGDNATAVQGGVAIGGNANGNNVGIAIGKNTYGYLYSIAIGEGATVGFRGLSLGHNTDSGQAAGLWASIAKGVESVNTRHHEEWRCADPVTSPYNKYGYGQVDWRGVTTDNTPTEIFLAGRANARFDIIANSAVAFNLNVIAYNNGDDVGRTWRIEGGIRRDGANNTTLISGAVVSTSIVQDGAYDGIYNTANWVCSVTADDVNEALAITVTGENTKTIRWNVEGSYSEVRF